MFKYIKLFLGLFLIVLLIWWVNGEALFEALSNLTFVSVFLLALVGFALIFISALKWQLFLQRLGGTASVLRLCKLYLVGYFVNLFLPSFLGGDAARSWYLGKSLQTEDAKAKAFAATILERYTGLVAMIFIALIFVHIETELPAKLLPFVYLCSFLLIFGSALAASEKVVTRLGTLKLPFLSPFICKVSAALLKVQQGLKYGMSQPKVLLIAVFYSFIFHILAILNTMAAAYAVGWWDPDFAKLCVVVPLILLVSAVPISPQNIGVQEGAFFFFLKMAGATSPQALGVAVILRLKSYVLAMLGYGFWLKEKRGEAVKS